jgi:hypothetical protein
MWFKEDLTQHWMVVEVIQQKQVGKCLQGGGVRSRLTRLPSGLHILMNPTVKDR